MYKYKEVSTYFRIKQWITNKIVNSVKIRKKMLNVILKERFDYKNLKDMIKINLTKEYLLHDTIKTKTKQKVGYN